MPKQDKIETSLNGILDGQVVIEQPVQGFRVAIDTILLAHFVPARSGDTVIDLGCGVGAALLALNLRVENLNLVGFEIEPALVALAHDNIRRNNAESRINVHQADVTNLSPFPGLTAQHVMINPPYHDAKRHDASPTPLKRRADFDDTNLLKDWFKTSENIIQNDGSLTIIHRADREKEILDALPDSFGTVEILALLPKRDREPKRIIIRAQKSRKQIREMTRLAPLVLHEESGRYTPEVESILRGRKSP